MITNHQRRVRVALAPLERYCQQLRRLLKLPLDTAAVRLVSDPRMARWNRVYRAEHASTDVLSFPSGDGRKHNRNRFRGSLRRGASFHRAELQYLGDIAISPLVAQRNARRFGRTLTQELKILILHGMLHLLGYDHETDRGEMERLENRLRRRLRLG